MATAPGERLGEMLREDRAAGYAFEDVWEEDRRSG